MEKVERKFSQDWFSNNIPNWNRLLNHFKDTPNLKFLEIGVFEGRSSCYLLDNILTGDNCELYCIDSFEGGPEHKSLDLTSLKDTFEHNISEYREKVKIYQGYSSEMLLSPEIRKNQYDFIYVDACHESKEVLEDTVLSFSLLKDYGIMIFDDYLGGDYKNEPTKNTKIAIDGFLSAYADYINIIGSAYQMYIQKTPKKRRG